MRRSARCALFLAAILSAFPLSAAKKKKKSAETKPSPTESTAITIPKEAKYVFFVSFGSDVLSLFENGSPDSIRSAVALIRKSSTEYKEDERIILNVARSIMEIVWTGERVTWDAQKISTANPYTGAIDSVKSGVYDKSTGKKDFLSTVLPSLLVVSNTALRDDFYDDAYADLKAALEKKPKSVLANYLMGMLLSKQSRYTEAISFLKKALSDSPQTFEISFALCDAYLKSKDYSAARMSADLLLDRFPQNLDVLKLCAETAFVQQDYPAAEEYVARVLQQEPENMQYILFRVKILLEKKEYIKAASLLDVYSRTDSSSRDYLLLRAKLQHYWNRNNTAALATIEDALEKYQGDKEILVFASQLASLTGGKVAGKNAGELARDILSEEPDNISALQISLSDMVKNGKWTEAYATAVRLSEILPDSVDVMFSYIDVCLALKKNEEAWSAAESLYLKNPQNDNVVQQYIKVLIALGRKSEAKTLIDGLLPTASSKMRSFLYYQTSFIVAGDDEILNALRSSLTSNPRNTDSLFRLYSFYYEKREFRKAQYYLKQVVALNPNDETYLKLNAELDTLIRK